MICQVAIDKIKGQFILIKGGCYVKWVVVKLKYCGCQYRLTVKRMRNLCTQYSTRGHTISEKINLERASGPFAMRV